MAFASAFNTGSSPSSNPFTSSPASTSKGAVPGSSSFAFAPKRPSALAHSYAAAEQEADEEDAEVGVLNLDPAFYPRRGRKKWVESGRTIGVAVAPVGGERLIWSKSDRGAATSSTSTSTPATSLTPPDKLLYLAAPHFTSEALHTFYLETATLFASLQQIFALGIKLPRAGGANAYGGARRAGSVADVWNEKGQLMGVDGILGPPSAETVGHMRKLVDMYVEELGKVQDATSGEVGEQEKWRQAYFIFYLAQILYLPSDGRGEGLVGEEILDWVNSVEQAPDNSTGNDIIQTREPWRHPSFWPYINRSILRGFHLPASTFLAELSKHPSPLLARIGTLLAKHIPLLPRSTNVQAYPLDHQFITAYQQWLTRFQTELAGAVGGRAKGNWFKGEDVGEGTEEEVRLVVELMEGNEETVLAQAADWREALGAWGVLVDVGLRRDDLPSTLKRILTDIPVEPLNVVQTIQSSLCTGKVIDALLGMHDLNPWLAAHLGDVFDKLALVPDDEERFDISLRDYFILDYTDVLQGCPQHAGLWRVIADYLAVAGQEGRARLKSHIMRTALRLDVAAAASKKDAEQPSGTADGDVFDVPQPRQGVSGNGRVDPYLHLFELRDACDELRIMDVWREIAKVSADRFIRMGEYGMGATMCQLGDDAAGLGKLAERVMEVYISQGAEAYLNIISTLPSAILTDAPQTLYRLANGKIPNNTPTVDRQSLGVFAARLAFMAEFRDYLVFTRQGDKERAAGKIVGLLSAGIVPFEYRAVLLGESVELLEDADILFDSSNTFELLRVLEEVTGAARIDAETYLVPLAKVLARRQGERGEAQNKDGKHNDKDKEVPVRVDLDGAWRCVEEVRLALARNLARAMVAGFDDPF